jgi:uncharacterized protein YggE
MSREPRDHSVVVVGHAERRVKPDRARWSITVETNDADERAAFDACSAIATQLMSALRVAAGESGAVGTAYVRVSPSYSSERKRYMGYDASTTVTVESGIDAAGRVAQQAVMDGVRRVSGPTFVVSDPEAIKAKLLGEAVEAAKSRAQRLAVAAERGLGPVLWIRERGTELADDHHDDGMIVMASRDEMREPEIVAEDQALGVDVIVAFEFSD